MSHGFDGDDDPLSVAPRAFQVDDGLSTPHLNDIMDRAMGKVKSMILELESDKGQIYYNFFTIHFTASIPTWQKSYISDVRIT